MKMVDYFKRFSEWQNYAHYLLLSMIISLVAYFYGAPIDFKMFIILFASLFIGDSIVHLIFYYSPKPIRWRD